MEIKPVLSFEFDIVFYENEIKNKGYCNNVYVSLPDLAKYRVCFYDPTRLIQDLEDENYIAETGLIIIKDVTIKNMEDAVYQLWLDGYFENQKSI